MEIFGWIMLILLAVFGMAILVVFAIPFVVTETTMMGYKIKRAIEDKKIDIEKRSDARRNRNEIKRQKDFELANKKLDAKLLKVDKQIQLHQKKFELAQELKSATITQKEELNKNKTILLEEQPKKVAKIKPIEKVVEQQPVVEEVEEVVTEELAIPEEEN